MHFTVAKTPLITALTRCAAVAREKSSQPILSHVLLQPMEGALIVSATDLEIGYTTVIDLSWLEITPVDCFKKITLPARKLLEMIKAIPVDAVEFFSLGNQTFTIKGGSAEFVLAGLDPAEYPEINSVEGSETTIAAKQLHDAISPVVYCQSKAADKLNLNGILLKLEENSEGDIFIVTAATDGHRLCLNSTPLLQNEDEPETMKPLEYCAELAKGVTIPSKAVTEILHLGTEGCAVLTMSGNNLCVSIGDERLTLRLIDQAFPDVTRVIPEKQTSRIIVKRQPLLDAIARVRVATDKETMRGINMETSDDDQIVLTSSLPQRGIEARDKITAEIIEKPEPVRLNSEYLAQALSNIHTASCELLFIDPQSPIMVVPSGTDFPQSVIMPMRGN